MGRHPTPKDVQAIPVGALFATPHERYSVPLYQRNYTWGEEQILRLVQDVLDEACQATPKEYFLGNMVVAPPTEFNEHFDVIDGQQRLTTLYLLLAILDKHPGFPNMPFEIQPLIYEARDKATVALREITRSGAPDPEREADREDSGIRQAAQILGDLLADPAKKQELIDAGFVEYLLSKVKVIRMPIDPSTDLNRYFEIMNTRGTQLSPTDIVKARLLRCLQRPDHRALLNHVWSACSDMSRYSVMTATAGDTSWRADVFGESWQEVPSADFAVLCEKLITRRAPTPAVPAPEGEASGATAMSLGEAISAYAGTAVGEESSELSDGERFTSQITFPTFLLHVLAVRSNGDESASLDRQLDDKKLVERFTTQLSDLDAHGREEWVRRFTCDLLRLRVLFDRYILKRDAALSSKDESTSDDEPGGWSLLRIAKGESTKSKTVRHSPKFTPTFSDDESDSEPKRLQQRILLLQSMLRITYTSPRTMHWITAVLRRSLESADHDEPLRAEDLLEVLEGFALERLDTALHPDPEKHEVGPDGVPLGFGIPRIVFTYLDYLLVEKEHRWDFTFSYRTSIEHFSPGTEDSEHSSPAFRVTDRRLLDYLGNLALVTVSANSKFSNYRPDQKAANRAARDQSVKLDLMAERALPKTPGEPGSWNDMDILTHHREMVGILFHALGKAPPTWGGGSRATISSSNAE